MEYLAKGLGGKPEDYTKIRIPDNMFIWATMNSADQGVFPMDTAFISLGGDSDTLAAITGSITEAAYGIPDWIKDKACSYLDEPLKDVLRRWKKYISRD